MERIRFTSPLRRDSGADYRSSPSDLFNAYLDPYDFSVRAVLGGTDVSALEGETIGAAPYYTQNDELISAGEEGLVAGDHFNEFFYGSTGHNVVVYPPSWNGTDDPDTDVPYVSSVAVSIEAPPEEMESYHVQGMVGYIAIPYNSRGEAGAWCYFWSHFVYNNYYRKSNVDGRHYGIKVKPSATISLSSPNTAYYEVYRTQEGARVATTLEEPTFTDVRVKPPYYYLGRITGSTMNGEDELVVATFTDDKTWPSPEAGYYLAYDFWELLDSEILGTGDVSSTRWTFNEVMEQHGFLPASQITLPSTTLDAPLNVWDAGVAESGGTATYDASALQATGIDFDAASTWPEPDPWNDSSHGFSAKTMRNHQGRMLYGNVTWATKRPAIAAAIPDAEGGTVCKLQHEYVVRGTTYYGPVLVVTNAAAILVPWQGESGLLVFDGSNKLISRVTPNSNGMYTLGLVDAAHVMVQTNVGSVGEDEYVAYKAESSWTWATGTAAALSAPTGLKSVTKVINEPNTVLISESQRPLEVTFNQFYLPDNSPVVALTAARASETDSLLAYDGYAFSEKSVFWFRLAGTDVTIDYVTQSVGLKDIAVGVAAIPIRDGVAMIGADDHLYVLRGRQIERIDRLLGTLWTELYDIAYDPRVHQLYILSDTGIWVWDFEVYQGIFKHINVDDPGDGAINFLWFSDYVGIVYVSGETQLLLEGDTARALDASVTTQPMRTGPYSKILDMTIDHDLGCKVRAVTTSGAAIALTGDESVSFSEDEIGAQILIAKALDGTSPDVRRISEVASGTEATLDDAVDSDVAGALAVWPVVDVEHTTRNPRLYTQTFRAWPMAKRFPRNRGAEHKLKVSKFAALREIFLTLEAAWP